jgi:hypothetical protein
MRTFIIFIFAAISFAAEAQNFSFDSGTTSPLQAPYKDGNAALEWKWTSASVLKIDYAVTNNCKNR